ncbi:putative metalloendopeptidase G1-type [Frankliniella fusca]|uniref:Metalloendopeptidase G1-type n=1 Tax=Frankliniella fusca TaxID=407009 RepID=A0AAE1H6P5_9NEOP|nr:putative metalloendopeptidase G1-type [Frankliniella fusca]KAK3917011.1 putative metalloendopeptidase G1-type [Frankliniella fusca]
MTALLPILIENRFSDFICNCFMTTSLADMWLAPLSGRDFSVAGIQILLTCIAEILSF